MNKTIFKKSKKTGFIALVTLVCLFTLVACNYLFDNLKKEEVYKPKSIDGYVELPWYSELDLSLCSVQSIYESSSLSDGNFTLQVESADVQQMVYFIDENESVLMIGFLNANPKEIVINTESTATGLIMLLLNAGGADKSDWDDLVEAISESEYFPPLCDEVESLVENQIDIFSEDNISLMEACADLIDNLSGDLKSTTVVNQVQESILPLIVTSSGKTVTVNNNGAAPLYQITMTKDGEEISRQNLLAAVPVKLSIGNILTGQIGAYNAPPPIEFSLSKSGEYQFRASSMDANNLVYSPSFANVMVILNNILGAAGCPIGNECQKELANFVYNIVVSTVVEMSTSDKNGRDGIRIIINFLLSRKSSLVTLLTDCAKREVGNSAATHTALSLLAAKYTLKFFDVFSKVESGTNAVALISFWASLPKEITFCRQLDGDQIIGCGAAAQFNAVVCVISNQANFISYDNGWASNSFGIGERVIPEEGSLNSTGFSFSGTAQYNKNSKFEVSGTISHRIITNISFKQTIENYQFGVVEDRTTKNLDLKNLNISLDNFSEDGSGYFEINNPTNNIDKMTDVSEVYSFQANTLIPGKQLESYMPNVLSNGGKIVLSFSLVK